MSVLNDRSSSAVVCESTQRTSQRSSGDKLSLCFAMVALAVVLGCNRSKNNVVESDDSPVVQADSTADTTRPGVDDNDTRVTLTASQLRPVIELEEGFVASETCLQCHADEHQSWHASFHRTMTQVVSVETAPSAIADGEVVVQGKRYLFEQSGDSFFVTYSDPFRGGMTMRRELLLMTGSHHKKTVGFPVTRVFFNLRIIMLGWSLGPGIGHAAGVIQRTLENVSTLMPRIGALVLRNLGSPAKPVTAKVAGTCFDMPIPRTMPR